MSQTCSRASDNTLVARFELSCSTTTTITQIQESDKEVGYAELKDGANVVASYIAEMSGMQCLVRELSTT